MSRKRKLSTEMTLADVETQLIEVSEELRLAETHVQIKKHEARIKVLRAIGELVSNREKLRVGEELNARTTALQDLMGRMDGGVQRADTAPPFILPGNDEEKNR